MEMASTWSWENAPQDLIRLVTQFCEASEIFNLSLSCTSWNWIIDDEFVWQNCLKILRPYDRELRSKTISAKENVRSFTLRRKAVHSKKLQAKNLFDTVLKTDYYYSTETVAITNYNTLYYIHYIETNTYSSYGGGETKRIYCLDINEEPRDLDDLRWIGGYDEVGSYSNPIVYLTDQYAIAKEDSNPYRIMAIPIKEYINSDITRQKFKFTDRWNPDHTIGPECLGDYSEVYSNECINGSPYVVLSASIVTSYVFDTRDWSQIEMPNEWQSSIFQQFYKNILFFGDANLLLVDVLDPTKIFASISAPDEGYYFVKSIVYNDKIFSVFSNGETKAVKLYIWDFNTRNLIDTYTLAEEFLTVDKILIDGCMLYGVASSEVLFYDLNRRELVYTLVISLEDANYSLKLHGNNLVVSSRLSLFKISLDYEALMKKVQVALIPSVPSDTTFRTLEAGSLLNLVIDTLPDLDQRPFFGRYIWITPKIRLIMLFNDTQSGNTNELMSRHTVPPSRGYLPVAYYPQSGPTTCVCIDVMYPVNRYRPRGTVIVCAEEWNPLKRCWEMRDYSVEVDKNTVQLFKGLAVKDPK